MELPSHVPTVSAFSTVLAQVPWGSPALGGGFQLDWKWSSWGPWAPAGDLDEALGTQMEARCTC